MILLILLLIILALVAAYLMGPRPPRPKLTNLLPFLPSDLNQLADQVMEREKRFRLKKDNEARFIWANNSDRMKTEYSLLYLHGYGACWYEGFPLNVDFSRCYNCNAFFSRLASHGIDTDEELFDMTPDRLWESAKEALLIASQMGEKVIIMGTSTGATLALKLAAEFPRLVSGLILYSPNVKIYNRNAFMVSRPWGLQIARKIAKGNYRVIGDDFTSKQRQYAYCRQRIESVVYLQQLVESTMKKEIFRKVKAPVFLGYYYKDEEHQDTIVRVDSALKMFDQLGTPDTMKRKVAFPEAGDHVIACELYSKSVDEVRAATFGFARDILGLKPAELET